MDKNTKEFISQNFIRIEQTNNKVDSFPQSPPPIPESPLVGYIEVGVRGAGGGHSKKMSNITFKIKDACLALSNSYLSIAGAASLNSGLAILAACLITMNDLNKQFKIELSELDALVVFSLFKLSCTTKFVSAPELSKQITTDSNRGDIQVPTQKQIDSSLMKLSSIKAVNLSNNRIELVEEVTITGDATNWM